jgi:hypothetical protein
MKECDNSTRKIHISSNFILSISLLIMFDASLLIPSLHSNTPLHFTTLHPTTLYYTSLHFTTLHPASPNYTSLHFATLHHTSPNFTQLHYTSLYFTTLHPTSPNYTSLHFTSSHIHCTTLSFSFTHLPFLSFYLKYINNELNSVRTQSNTTMYFLSNWLLVSGLMAIISPILYNNLKERLVTFSA